VTSPRTLVTAMLSATLALGCAQAGGEDASSSSQSNAITASLQSLFGTTQQYIMATADVVPEELYAFQPTPEVRTMGQILAHVAAAQYIFCSGAKGEENPNTENFEETRTTKAAITEALQAGFAYCADVYAATTDANASTARTFFGSDNTVAGILAFNSAHNYEHYGNLVTYMRINDIVPPSSR
jgi:uncharacterized damage-inducible protein DinB